MGKHNPFLGSLFVLAALAALLCCAAPTVDGHRYSVLVGWSQTWALPANATNVAVTLWGGGGGAASTESCGAGGGSGAAILARPAGDAQWGVDTAQVQWTLTVGEGGAPLATPNLGGLAGDGGSTTVVAAAPNGTELFRATAYGGGGAYALFSNNKRGCKGGAGGGSASAAVGTEPGAGNPKGAADNNPLAAATEGALVGDVKAGGAGAGYGYRYNVDSQPFTAGAPWTSPGRQWLGGPGTHVEFGCTGWGGAAGFNGDGGNDQYGVTVPPPFASGSGGGSAHVCRSGRAFQDSRGAGGGVLIEYTHPVSPVVALRSSASGKYLTAHSYSGVSANAAAVQAWERWSAVRLDDGRYAFRSWQNKYLKANPTDSVEASAAVASTWEQFEVVLKGTDRWSLKNHYGKYVVAAADGFVLSATDADHFWQIVYL